MLRPEIVLALEYNLAFSFCLDYFSILNEEGKEIAPVCWYLTNFTGPRRIFDLIVKA